MKIILLLIAVMLLMVGADARYSPGLEIAEGENITLDGGFIKNFQSDGAFNILAYGATPNDFTDDASSIQDCYDAANDVYESTGIKQVVNWPPGEFNGNSSQAPGYPGIIVKNRPGVITKGAGIGATIFRAKDNFRNTTQGVMMLWNEDEYLPGTQIRDMTFECGNNTVQAGENNFTVCAGAYWTTDAVIENVECRNVSGTWAIVLGGMPGKEDDCHDADVEHIYVKNYVGSSVADDDTYDHTSMRINMDRTILKDCILENYALPSNAAGFEIHGNESTASGLIIKNYTNGCLMGTDDTDSAYGQMVSDCEMRVVRGIGIWSVTGSEVVDFFAHDNKIDLISGGPGIEALGFGTVSAGDLKNITIIGNEVTNSSDEEITSLGMSFTGIENLVCRENVIRGMSIPIRITSSYYIENYDISDNSIDGWGYHMPEGQYSTGIYLSLEQTSPGGQLVVNGNSLLSKSGHEYYGILLYAPNLSISQITNNNIPYVNGVDITTITPSAYWTNENIFIDHVSYNKFPKGTGWAIDASDGSTWLTLSNSTSCRKATTWRKVSWTYA